MCIILDRGTKAITGIYGVLNLHCLCVVILLLLFFLFIFAVFFFFYFFFFNLLGFFCRNNIDKNVQVVFGHWVIVFCFYSLAFRIANFHKISGQILSDFDFPTLYQQKQKYYLIVFENILNHVLTIYDLHANFKLFCLLMTIIV